MSKRLVDELFYDPWKLYCKWCDDNGVAEIKPDLQTFVNWWSFNNKEMQDSWLREWA